jgi:predicted nuclease of predicted toxin-antitoxin system
MIPPILIDMNLSVKWVDFFEQTGIQSIHWSTIGDVKADDKVLFDWAKANQFAVFTNDLDFGMLLAMTRSAGPSVIQVRSPEVLPRQIGNLVLSAITQHSEEIAAGSLLVIEKSKLRVRILPLK